VYKAYHFLKRNARIAASYRTALVLDLLRMVAVVGVLSLVARFLVGPDNPYLSPYGGRYLEFVVVGLTFQGFVTVGLHAFGTAVRGEQQAGTLEFLLLSDTPIELVLLSSGLFDFVMTALGSGLGFGAMVLLFDLQLRGHLLSAGVILLLSTLAMASLGLMSAGILLITKQGDPVTWLFGVASTVLSGVLFPTAVLPAPLQALARLLPNTWALEALRAVLLQGAGLAQVAPILGGLLAFTALSLPLAVISFRYGFARARMEGTLGQY